jgi:hypothetical protein
MAFPKQLIFKVFVVPNIFRLIVLMVLCFSTATSSWGRDASGETRLNIESFTKTHCIKCHGSKKQEGDMRLDNLSVKENWSDLALFENILEQIESGEMPPEKAKAKPAASAIDDFTASLKKHLTTIGAQQSRGVLKRLNRTEYRNTIMDVFGVDFDMTARLPIDNEDDGFDNTGEKLSLSDEDLEAYYEVGLKVVEKSVNLTAPVDIDIYRTKNAAIRSFTENGHDLNSLYAPLPRIKDKTQALVFAHSTMHVAIELAKRTTGTFKFEPKGYYLKGQYKTTHTPGLWGGKVESEYRSGVKKDAVTLSKRKQWLYYFVIDPPSFRTALKKSTTTLNARPVGIRFTLDEGFEAEVKPGQLVIIGSVPLPLPMPEDITAYCEAIRKKNAVGLPNDLGNNKKLIGRFLAEDDKERVAFCIEEIKVKRVYNADWRPPETKFYKEHLNHIKLTDGIEECRVFLRKLARRLYRRPVTDEIIATAIANTKVRLDIGFPVDKALQAGVHVLLCSPLFLYKHEGRTGQLDDYAIASRLSYFAWNTLPDQTLLGLADQGKLQNPAVRREQLLRLLADPKAQRFTNNFVSQWLKLDRLDHVTPTKIEMSAKDYSNIKKSISTEPIVFFNEVLSSNLSMLNFIDSDFVVVTPELSSLYGLAKSGKTSVFKKMKLTPEQRKRRGGFFTQSAVLLMTTNDGQYTNPFYRGAWLMNAYYGDHLKPPADVALAVLKPATKQASIRANIREHRNNPACISCHKKMDPYGLAMEHYDVMGRWRENYFMVEGGKKKTMRPVEAQAEHSDGRKFTGPEGMKKILMEDKEIIIKKFIATIFTYIMAREPGFGDRETLGNFYQTSATSGYKLRDLLVDIVESKSFVKR